MASTSIASGRRVATVKEKEKLSQHGTGAQLPNRTLHALLTLSDSIIDLISTSTFNSIVRFSSATTFLGSGGVNTN